MAADFAFGHDSIAFCIRCGFHHQCRLVVHILRIDIDNLVFFGAYRRLVHIDVGILGNQELEDHRAAGLQRGQRQLARHRILFQFDIVVFVPIDRIAGGVLQNPAALGVIEAIIGSVADVEAHNLHGRDVQRIARVHRHAGALVLELHPRQVFQRPDFAEPAGKVSDAVIEHRAALAERYVCVDGHRKGLQRVVIIVDAVRFRSPVFHALVEVMARVGGVAVGVRLVDRRGVGLPAPLKIKQVYDHNLVTQGEGHLDVDIHGAVALALDDRGLGIRRQRRRNAGSVGGATGTGFAVGVRLSRHRPPGFAVAAGDLASNGPVFFPKGDFSADIPGLRL